MASNFRLLNAVWNEIGGKWNPGNARPAAAAAWSDCNNAAECSCAFRLSSATDVDRGSAIEVTNDEPELVVGVPKVEAEENE